MNSKDILTRSRKENEVFDERYNLIKIQGASFSIGVLFFLWIVLTRFAQLDEIGNLALGLLTHATCFSTFVFQLVKNRTKTSFLPQHLF